MATQSRQDTRHILPAATGLTDDDKYKFVNIDGGEAALAVAGEVGFPLLAVEGESATFALDNKQKVTAAGAITAGDELASDANGLAVVAAGAGTAVNGIALEDGAANQVISYLVTHYRLTA